MLISRLDAFPRFALSQSFTPISRLSNLEKHFGLAGGDVSIFVKRDDVGLVGGGGNKLRKLEYLLGHAIEENADTVVTVGGLQSNHARLTAAACALAGLRCELVLTRQVPRDDVDYERNGNVMLDDIFGAVVNIFASSVNAHEWALQRCVQLRAEGRRVHYIPGGGSSARGALGYARCAAEILAQEKELGITFDKVIVANGSAGTHAGLAAGYVAAGKKASVVRSYAVLADLPTAIQKTTDLITATLALLGETPGVPIDDVDINGDHRGGGYGIPTAEMKAAVRLVARTEAILLDPVYSGKAFAGMLADMNSGAFDEGRNLLFIATGGTPGLFAYRTEFES